MVFGLSPAAMMFSSQPVIPAITTLLVRATSGPVTSAVLRECNRRPGRLGRRPVHAAGWRSRGGTHQSHVRLCRAGPADRHPDHGAASSAGRRAPSFRPRLDRHPTEKGTCPGAGSLAYMNNLRGWDGVRLMPWRRETPSIRQIGRAHV